MNEEIKEASFLTKLLRYTGTIFTFTVLAMTIAGMVLSRLEPDLRETSSLFVLAPLGLAYNTILQILTSSVILAIISTFLFSENFFYKLRFLPRTIIFLLTALIIFSLFAIVFKWLPINDSIGWLKFFISTFVCFFISIGLTLVKHKLEAKKYNKLLKNYKARHNILSI